jgi:RHS repeat-associated protein
LGTWGTLTDANVYRFSSKEWDGNLGLYYYLYRFYDPYLQRWLNQDPIGERGGNNLYQYIQNDPVNYFDAFGLYRDCGAEYNACMSACMKKRSPWEDSDNSKKCNKWKRYAYCEATCQAAYMACEAENAAEGASNALKWCEQHPGFCATIIIPIIIIAPKPVPVPP